MNVVGSKAKPAPMFRTGADLLHIQEIGKVAYCDDCGIDGHENVSISSYFYRGDKLQFCHRCAVRRGVA